MKKKQTKLRLTTYGIFEINKNNGMKKVLFRLHKGKWSIKIHDKELVYLPGRGAHILLNINALAIIICRSNKRDITFNIPKYKSITIDALEILNSNNHLENHKGSSFQG